MTRIKFVHCADLHLDSPFKGLFDVAPEIAGSIYNATFETYDNIINLCLQERVDALFVAGDIFDGGDRSLKAQLRFVAGLNKLESSGIRSFICHGNHDPLDGWEAQLTYPPGCHRFGPEVTGVPVFENEPERAMVYGISYSHREVRENLVPKFNNVNPGSFNIGLLHANVGTDTGHDSYAPCTLSDLEQSAVNYWALGHVHTNQILRQQDPAVVYPGNPQGRHINEPGGRGVYLVEVTDAKKISMKFRSVDSVRWEAMSLDISELESEQGLLDAMDNLVADCQAAADGRSVIFRLTLFGRGTLHQTLIRPEFVEDSRQSINEIWSQQQPFLWCDRIHVTTGFPFDKDTLRLQSDFVGDLLKISDEVHQGTDFFAEMRNELNELYGRGGMANLFREYPLTETDLRELLADAQEICLDKLLDENSGG